MSNDNLSAVLGSTSEIKSKRAVLCEKTLSYISEIAEVLIDEAGDDEIFFRDDTFISRYHAVTAFQNESSAAPYNEIDVNAVEKQLNEAEKALLCLRLTDILGISGIEDSGIFFDDPPKTSGETVSCVKSRLSDDAYIAFASEMVSPRVSYESDLNEVCQSVLYGKTAYGVLPESNSKTLFKKYGLKTAGRITLDGQDGVTTAFLLVKKDVDIPKSAENILFEFIIEDIESINGIMTAAEICGIEPARISYSANEKTLNAALKIKEDGFCGFLTYLSLNYPGFITVGIYKEL